MYKSFLTTLFLTVLLLSAQASDPFATGENVLKSELKMYPNPTPNGIFTLEFGAVNTSHIDVVVYSMIGEIVLNAKIRDPHINLYTVNLSKLPAGNYFVNLTSGQERITKRISIKR